MSKDLIVPQTKPNRALVCGASGLIGQELLAALLVYDIYSEVVAFYRGVSFPETEKWLGVQVDYDKLEDYRSYFENVSDIYCCLGTTRKKAGNKQAFRQVDLDYPLEVATLGREMGAKHFMVISALGADPKSKVFYFKLKGELEEKLKELDYDSLTIFRPSLLVGFRRDIRLGEFLAQSVLNPFNDILRGPFLNYKPIDAKKVAEAMIMSARHPILGVQTIESKAMQHISLA